MSSRSLASSVASGGDASIDERPPNRRLHRGLGSFLSASMLSMASGDLSTPIAEGDEDGSSSDDEDVMGEPQTEAARLIEHVTQALQEHEATFKMIFPFYCRLEKFSNREFLSRGMFRKLICDSKLGKRPDDLAQIDVTFATGLKSNPPEYTEHKLTFGAFLAALAAFIIDKFHVTPAKTSDVVVHVMTDYVTNLRRLEEVCDTSELRVPKAVAVMQKERSLVQQIFTHYADHHSRKTRILRDQMFKFAKDFHLTPRLCTRKEMHDIVSTAVSQDGAFVTFPHFLECIGMIAIIGFSKLDSDTRHSTGAKKLVTLFKWIRQSEYLAKLQSHQHSWGASRAGRGLNKEQMRGELQDRPRRRISIANKVGGATMDMSAIVKRRRSTLSVPIKDQTAVVAKASNTPIRYGLRLTAPEDANPMHRPDVKVSVDPDLLARLKKAMLRFSGKIKPVFDFYCRLTDPSNRGFMTFLNFRRLLRDCEAMDDIINANMVNLQLLTITRNKAKDHLDKQNKLKGVQEGVFSSLAAETFGGKLDLEMFLEALCRVSELIRVGQLRFGDGDLVRKIPVEPFGKVFQEAKKAATSFILQRVAPLSQLNYVDDECADVLEEPDVKKALKLGERLLERAFAFYANVAGGHVAMVYAQFLALVRDFEIVPKLVSLCDAEHAFYTVCRRNDTDCRDKIDVTPVFFHSVGKTRDTSYVTFRPFTELMGRIALVGFSKPFLQHSHPESPQKITALFQWIQSSGNLLRIQQAEWQRGLTRNGRRMTEREKQGIKESTVASPRESGVTWGAGSGADNAGAGGGQQQAAVGRRSGQPARRVSQGPLRSVLLSTTPGLPPPPPIDNKAHAHFRTLGDFEVVSVGGLATSGASQAPHPASPAPTPNSPFPYATRGHQSPGLFSPIHGGVAAVSPAGRSFTGSPAHQDLSAVGTAISALSDALQGSVEGLEGIADPMTGAGAGADGAAVEEHRVNVVHNAQKLQRIAGALYSLVSPDAPRPPPVPPPPPASEIPQAPPTPSPPPPPEHGVRLLSPPRDREDRPLDAADLAVSFNGGEPSSPPRSYYGSTSPRLGPPATPATPAEARTDAVRSVASQLVQELTREVARQNLITSHQGLTQPTPQSPGPSYGTTRYTPWLHRGLVPHSVRTGQDTRHRSLLVQAPTGQTQLRSSSRPPMTPSSAQFATPAAAARARPRSHDPARSGRARVRASVGGRTSSAAHRGEREFLRRQAAGRRQHEARKWVENHRVVHTADWVGTPTRISAFHLSPGRPCREHKRHHHHHHATAGHAHHHDRDRDGHDSFRDDQEPDYAYQPRSRTRDARNGGGGNRRAEHESRGGPDLWDTRARGSQRDSPARSRRGRNRAAGDRGAAEATYDAVLQSRRQRHQTSRRLRTR